MKKETVNNLPIIFGAISIILLPIMFLSAILAILAIFLGFKNKKSRLTGIILGILVMIMIIVYTIIHIALGFSPVVLINSCSMYHNSDFENWWEENKGGYESNNITKTEFLSYSFKNGLNKGDIILVIGKKEYKKGDIIIFNAATAHPLIHRLINTAPLSTKGDHNTVQLSIEKTIAKEAVIGKSFLRIPLLGWIKLIFFEPFRPEYERGLCV